MPNYQTVSANLLGFRQSSNDENGSMLKTDQIGSLLVVTSGSAGKFATKVIDKYLGPVWLEEYNSLDKAIVGHGEAIAYASESQL